MPSDPTAEQVELRQKGRQRLIGAVTLALLAVVFVPMLLDPEPRQQRVEQSVAIPSKEAVAPLTPVIATPSPTSESGPPPAQTPVVASEQRKMVEPRAAEFKSPAAKANPPSNAEAKLPAEPAEKPVPRLDGFAVQVGAFREEAKLSQARDKLVAARLPHYTERLETTSGELTRLRAGPYATRDAAEKAAAAMKRVGVDGRVVPLP
jgi:DedD protein